MTSPCIIRLHFFSQDFFLNCQVETGNAWHPLQHLLLLLPPKWFTPALQITVWWQNLRYTEWYHSYPTVFFRQPYIGASISVEPVESPFRSLFSPLNTFPNKYNFTSFGWFNWPMVRMLSANGRWTRERGGGRGAGSRCCQGTHCSVKPLVKNLQSHWPLCKEGGDWDWGGVSFVWCARGRPPGCR